MPLNEHEQRRLRVPVAGAGHLAMEAQIGGGQAKTSGPSGWGEYGGYEGGGFPVISYDF